MWGKPRVASVALRKAAREFNSSKKIQELRLLSDPCQPWSLPSLIEHRGRLNDGTCATIVKWCREMRRLSGRPDVRSHVTHQALLMMKPLLENHGAGHTTLHQFWILCAEARQLTPAFDIMNHAIEMGRIKGLTHYVALMRIVEQHPEVEDATAATLAIVDMCCKDGIWCREMEEMLTRFVSRLPTTGFAELRKLMDSEGVLRRLRVQCSDLSGVTDYGFPLDEQHEHLGWSPSVVRDFRGGIFLRNVDLTLISGLLPSMNRIQLRNAAAIVDLKATMAAVTSAKQHLEEETKAARSKLLNQHDGFIAADRIALLQTCDACGRVTPDMYHFVIEALRNSPASVLRTLDTMDTAGVEPLDVTLAIAARAVAADGVQLRRIIDKFEARNAARLKHCQDYFAAEGVEPQVESWWKYAGLDELQHMNALPRSEFYNFLGQELGHELVARVGGQTIDDAVILDAEIADSVAGALAHSATASPECIDFVPLHCPKLDIALLGRIQYFDSFVPHRPYALGVPALRQLIEDLTSRVVGREHLEGFTQPAIVLVDASFLMASPKVLEGFRMRNAIVLVPYCSMRNMSEAQSTQLIANNPAQAALANLRTVLQDPLTSGGLVLDVFHFSESLFALSMPMLMNEVNDYSDAVIVSNALMFSTLFPHLDVGIATDDPTVIAALTRVSRKVGNSKPIRCIQPQVVDNGGETHARAASIVSAFPTEFQPVLETLRAPVPEKIAPPNRQNGSWLDLLEDNEDTEASNMSDQESSPSAEVADFDGTFHRLLAAGTSQHSNVLTTPHLERMPSKKQASRNFGRLALFRARRLGVKRVQANVNDPRNASLLRRFEAATSHR